MSDNEVIGYGNIEKFRSLFFLFQHNLLIAFLLCPIYLSQKRF